MGDTCKYDGCDRARRTKGFCGGHYVRDRNGWDMSKPWRKFGDPEGSFWQKVQKGDGCWLWSGSLNVKGYGQQRIDGTNRLAHRYSYELANGPIPDGVYVDHLCYTPACVRPEHLRLATPGENLQNLRGASSASKSGVRGVYWIAEKKAWRAEVTLDYKSNHLGYFSTVEEAERAAVAWRREHMPFSEMDKRKEIA